jgi:hypothetical protein
VEESFDGSFAYPDESSAQPSPFKPSTPLPVSHADRGQLVGAPQLVSTDIHGAATGNPANVAAGDKEKGGNEVHEQDDYPVPSAWGDEPSPEQLQQIQDRVSAWLDTSRPSAFPSTGGGLRFPSTIETSVALLEVPEEDETELISVRQPLRMLDSISEDEIPPFVGSSVSTAPSTPLPPSQLARSRSQSPPLRRRSLEGQEDYYSRGLDTIQEAGDAPLPSSPRRSLDSGKKALLALESIPEIEPSPTTSISSTKRRLGIKGFGFTRSESEPLMPTIRSVPFNPTTTTSPNSKQAKRKAPTLNPNIFIGGKPVPSGRAGLGSLKEGMLPSPTLPSFQRGAKLVMGQRSTLGPASASGSASTLSEPRAPLNLRIHSPGSIAVETEKIEDEESRRQTEIAFM